jgi:lipopolysaccharide/colanic/teichoic acid biosynthesis glycosyltransferase
MRPRDRFFNLLLICAGFAVALFVYNTFFQGGLTPKEMLAGSGASVLAFWAATEWRNNGSAEGTSWWVSVTELFCFGTGANLLLHAVLTYAFYIRRTPFLIAAGGLFSAALLSFRAQATAERDRTHRRFLLIGFDSIARSIFSRLKDPLIGVLTNQPALVPAGTPYLGDPTDIGEILRKHQPTNIVVSMAEWENRIPPAVLLNCRLSGVVVEESHAVYERFFNRVCCERLQPVELLLSSALRGDSRTIAIQSVYTDLIALTLLLALSPLMLIIALAVRLFSGPGPVFVGVECAGFQYIPFRLLRFRTRRTDGTGSLTGIGRLINRLNLTNLPQLFNVVRGDMALVGPRPVRAEFARYLTDVMPFYSHRFSVKPGILGWARMHVPEGVSLPDECRQIEYDLFYVKEGCLWLDAEIIFAALTPSRTRTARAAVAEGTTAPS